MAKRSEQENSRGRKTFTTTINSEKLLPFKIKCVELGLPMNTVLENFMERFAAGTLKFEPADK